MEIVLAVLLLFGGFALGSATADKGSDANQSTAIASHANGVADSVPVTPAMRGCLSDKSVVYRNLTVPTRGHIERSAFETNTCEGDCPDE